MLGITHVVCLGAEPVQLHTAGLARFGGREALLFVPPTLTESLEAKQEEILRYAEYGMPLRPVVAPLSYREALPIAVTEVEGYVEAGSCIGINGNTGSRGVNQAVSDSVFAALVALHPNVATSDDGAASAFHYYPRLIEGPEEIDVAPFFNIANPLHTGILLAMAEADEPLSARELFEIVSATIGPGGPSSYDNFRRHLNSVRCWLKYVPGFIEEKGDRYRYRI